MPYPLQGLVLCGKCKGRLSMRREHVSSRGYTVSDSWQCIRTASNNHCGKISRNARLIDTLVDEFMATSDDATVWAEAMDADRRLLLERYIHAIEVNAVQSGINGRRAASMNAVKIVTASIRTVRIIPREEVLTDAGVLLAAALVAERWGRDGAQAELEAFSAELLASVRPLP